MGLLLVPPTLAFTRQPITVSSTWAVEFFNGAGFSQYPPAFVTVALLTTLGWILLSGVAIILVHEGVHYVVGIILKINPQFEWHSQFGVPNPSVVAYATRISRWENILMLGSPFVLLSVVLAGLMWMTNGIVAGTSGIMFCINAVPSCSDVYKVDRIFRMPAGTLFANFDEKDGLRTEFAVPTPRG
jgi:hypothetical protein